MKIAILERWSTAVSEGIVYKTKTACKKSTDHKNAVTFKNKKKWQRRIEFFDYVLCFKVSVFTELMKILQRQRALSLQKSMSISRT